MKGIIDMVLILSKEQLNDIREWISEQLEYQSLEIEYAKRLTDLLQSIDESLKKEN